MVSGQPNGDAPADDSVRGVRGRVLVPGRGRGHLMSLTHPISFWGGVDPARGEIVDPRHPQHGMSITGRVLLVPAAVGSSSSSAIMLELLREGTAPAAILMGKADAILALGCIVGSELGYDPIPILEVPVEAFEYVFDGAMVEVHRDGLVRVTE
jgi:predicted aconitase with swiveling domain